MDIRKRMAWGILAAGLIGLAGCGTSPSIPNSPLEQDQLDAQAKAVMADFRRGNPAADALIRDAYAYAVFPEITSGAVLIGGAHGEGEVFRNKAGGGAELVGYADVSQGSVGAQLGGQSFAQIIFFKTEVTFTAFTTGDLAFDARASAVAASNGAATAADYEKGVLVVTQARGGLMAQAAIGGQKFRYMPLSARTR